MTGAAHCLVIGVGAGTGAACARRFAAERYRVSMIARSPERLAGFQADIPGSKPYPVDIVDLDGYRATLRRIGEEQGPPDVVIYNATQATFAPLHELDPLKLERNFRTNTTGLLVAAQELTPAMVAAGRGALIVTGNTAALRGRPSYVGWASTKAAQRNLAESLARELGPKGIHVAYVVIDAMIDMPFARRSRQDLPVEAFARPDDLAGEILNVVRQPRSAWSFLVELRPFGEAW